MAVMKRLIIVLVVVTLPLMLGLLFTYDIIKIDWISFMEIQPSGQPQRDPLPMPAGSVPVQGAYISAEAGAPENPYEATENSVARGQYFYEIACLPCHGADGKGNPTFRIYLQQYPPADLTANNAVNLSDGEIFVIISEGIEGRMPNMRYNLPDEEMRWAVVNYVRTLQEAGQ